LGHLTRLLSVVVLAGLLAAPAAGAAPLGWTASTPINAAGDANGIACPTPSLCVVAADNGQVSVSKNPAAAAPTWSTFDLPVSTSGSVPADFVTVACPAADRCLASDREGDLFTSDNAASEASWKKHVFPVGPNYVRTLDRISCPSGGLCVAWDDGNRQMLTTTSPDSAAGWQPDTFTYDVNDVACTAAPTRCIAPSGSAIAHTTNPGGGFDTWTAVTHIGYCWPDLAPSCDTIEAVACLPAFCIAGGHGTAGKNGGLYWTDKPLGTASDWQVEPSFTSEVRNMACAPVGVRCVASTDDGQYVWDSTNPTGGKSAWSVTPHATTNGLIAQVSCPDEHTCFAAADSGFLSVGRDGAGGGGTPGGGGGGTPGGGGGPPVTPPPLTAPSFNGASLGRIPSTLSGNSLTLLLQSASDSMATVRIVSRRPLLVWISKKAKARVRTFGSAKTALKADVAKKVKVKLTKPARRYFKRHPKAKVRIIVTATSTTGVRKTTTKTATVKRSKR
jgi:hypothetical protein